MHSGASRRPPATRSHRTRLRFAGGPRAGVYSSRLVSCGGGGVVEGVVGGGCLRAGFVGWVGEQHRGRLAHRRDAEQRVERGRLGLGHPRRHIGVRPAPGFPRPPCSPRRPARARRLGLLGVRPLVRGLFGRIGLARSGLAIAPHRRGGRRLPSTARRSRRQKEPASPSRTSRGRRRSILVDSSSRGRERVAQVERQEARSGWWKTAE